MAFAPVSPLSVLWRGHGLRCLLREEDVPPELSFLAQNVPLRAAPARRPVPDTRPPAREGNVRVNARPAPGTRAPAAAPAAGRPAQAKPREETPPEEARSAAPSMPPLKPEEEWPALWRERLKATRPGRVAWTYARLGQDLLGERTEGLDDRRAFIGRLLRDMNHPVGTHTFWPVCLHEEGAMKSAPEIFWSGIALLGARFVMVLGEDAAASLALPSPLPVFQQTVWRGVLISAFPGVDALLCDEANYAAMLSMVREKLRRFAR